MAAQFTKNQLGAVSGDAVKSLSLIDILVGIPMWDFPTLNSCIIIPENGQKCEVLINYVSQILIDISQICWDNVTKWRDFS